MKSHPEWHDADARVLAESFAALPGGLLPALKALQETYGFVDQRGIDLAADVFNLSRAEVYGVVHFYDDFRDEPLTRPALRICMGEACQAVGARKLEDAARTRYDQSLEIGRVFCLGNCSCGPSILLEEAVHGRVSETRLDILVAGLQGEAS